jgi:hypothetical protein
MQDKIVDNKLFQNVAVFKYLGTNIINKNLIHEDIVLRAD